MNCRIIKKYRSTVIIAISVIVIVLMFANQTLATRLVFPNWFITKVQSWLSSSPDALHACDYKDGEIILVKPVATGVGDGRYEAGDIVEIRDGDMLCARFGDGNFLGNEERSKLLPLYYPAKLPEEQKKMLLESEVEMTNDKGQMTNQDQNSNDKNEPTPPSLSQREGERVPSLFEREGQDGLISPLSEKGGQEGFKMVKRRKTGVDYTEFLSATEIMTVRSEKELKRIPTVDLSSIIDKASGLSLNPKSQIPNPKQIQNTNDQNTKRFEIGISNLDIIWNLVLGAWDLNLKNIARTDSVIKLPWYLSFYENSKNHISQLAQNIIKPVTAQSNPTELTKTVDTGGYADYLSLNAWEAATQKDLTLSNEIAIADCQHKTSSSTADTTAVAIAGWTTDATRYIKIWTDPAKDHRHNGVWSNDKFSLVVSNNIGIETYNIDYVKIDGLQIWVSTGNANYQYPISLDAISSSNLYDVSNCILKGHGGDYATGAVAINGDVNLNLWNTIMYNFGTVNANSRVVSWPYNGTLNIYNCTGIGGYIGLNHHASSAGTVTAKNCYFGGSYGYDGAIAMTNCAASDSTGSTGLQNIATSTVNFRNNIPGSEDWRIPYNSALMDAGSVTSGDAAPLNFTTDIEGQIRPYGLGASSTKWDIGADEYQATPIYRSVGPSNTSPLAAGYLSPYYGATLSVSGDTATFSTGLPLRTGVGDVIIYTSTEGTGNTATNSVAFIHGRTSPTVYTVKDVAGKRASSTYAATTKWAIYRAYESLSKAESGDENDCLLDGLEAFESWSNGKNLASSTEQWNIAGYGDASDTTAVTIDGWTTTADNYIRIFTPTVTADVGMSQRHSGTWNDNKYRLVLNNNENALIIYEEFVRIDGLQISQDPTQSSQDHILIEPSGSTSDVRISNCIIKGVPTSFAIYGISVGHANANVSIWNCILYNFLNSSSGIGIYSEQANSVSVRSTTVANAYRAFRRDSGSTNDFTCKNCYGQASNAAYSGIITLTTSASSDTTGTAGLQNIGTTTNFVSNVAGSEDWHLPATSALIGAGTNTSVDSAPLNFTTDIDGETRASAWDIGADQMVVRPIYRSVGPSNTSALALGAANAMTITDDVATFASALPNNIGVGDVIVYDATNDNATDTVAFIHGRTDPQHYTVKDVAGRTATSTVAATNKWAIYRAYTSLSKAVDDDYAGDENDGLPDGLENFDTWSLGKKLASSTEIWNVACYADAVDTTHVDIYGNWVTATATYIKVYTPYLASEVGTSQRHSGKWDTSGYRMEIVDDLYGRWPMDVAASYVRVDGLQIKVTSDAGNYHYGISVGTFGNQSEYFIRNNIIKGNFSGTANAMAGISTPAGGGGRIALAKIWNNIIYDFKRAGASSGNGIEDGGAAGNVTYIYNNTLYNNIYGIASNYTAPVVVKNNIAGNNTTDYFFSGPYTPVSATNISSDNTSPDAAYRNKKVNFANTKDTDFHLSPADVWAKDHGADLSADSNLAFSTDIDGEARGYGGAWDIGADETKAATQVNSKRPLSAGLSSGLVGYWSFNGEDMNWSSTTAEALDRSGNNNNGNTSNFDSKSTAAGKLGQTINFDGVNDEVVLDGLSDLDFSQENAFTLSAWVYPDNTSDSDTVFSRASPHNASIYTVYYLAKYNINGTRWTAKISDGTNLIYAISGVGTVSANAWQHMVLAWDGTDLTIYKNKISIATAQNVSFTTLWNGDTDAKRRTSIGAEGYTAQYFWDGKIDEVRVYNRALSLTEISELYESGQSKMKINSPAPTPQGLGTGLIGYWSFNGPDMNWASTTAEALDRSGQGNHGNVVGLSNRDVTAGLMGQALKNFKQTSYTYVDVPDIVEGLSALTISAWVKPSEAAPEQIRSILDQSGSTPDSVFLFQTAGGGYRCRIYNDDQTVALVSVNGYKDVNWHHIVCLYNGAEVDMYIDGTLVESDNPLSGVIETTAADNLAIGDDDNVNNWDGALDEVRIYNRALTADEVKELYEMGARKAEVRNR